MTRSGDHVVVPRRAGIAIEADTIAAPWSHGDPSTRFVVLEVSACALNAVGSIVAVARLRPTTGGGLAV